MLSYEKKTLFQDMHPMLTKSDIIIFLSEKATEPCTVFISGLNFTNSYWQLSGVNVQMEKCQAAFLTLEIKSLTNAIVENSTLGNWTFIHVQHIFMKNNRNFFVKGFSTSFNFSNSSGLIKNVTIKDLNFANMPTGVMIQNNSYIQITKSSFTNNIVTLGIIKVLNSSTLHMSDCKFQKNKAIDYAGAIFSENSKVHLTNINFDNNKADWGGGALYVKNNSFST